MCAGFALCGRPVTKGGPSGPPKLTVARVHPDLAWWPLAHSGRLAPARADSAVVGPLARLRERRAWLAAARVNVEVARWAVGRAVALSAVARVKAEVARWPRSDTLSTRPALAQSAVVAPARVERQPSLAPPRLHLEAEAACWAVRAVAHSPVAWRHARVRPRDSVAPLAPLRERQPSLAPARLHLDAEPACWAVARAVAHSPVAWRSRRPGLPARLMIAPPAR